MDQQRVDQPPRPVGADWIGGTTALELMRPGSRSRPWRCSIPGSLRNCPGMPGARARLLVCNGAEDPLVKREAIDALTAELRRDRVDWQFIHYGNARHSFTDPDAEQRMIPSRRAEVFRGVADRQQC